MTIQNLLKTNPTLFEVWVKMTADETEEIDKMQYKRKEEEDPMDGQLNCDILMNGS